MQKPKKAHVEKERKIHMYAELWHASNCVLESGINEAEGSAWQFLSSVLLTAFTFEAYLNHVGPKVFQCWPELERLPPLSKFELLCEKLNVKFSGGYGQRPLQTIVSLIEFRNTMAHGRSNKINPAPYSRDINRNLDLHLRGVPLAGWEKLIKNKKFAMQARKDVDAVLSKVHASISDENESLFSFGASVHSATFIQSSNSN